MNTTDFIVKLLYKTFFYIWVISPLQTVFGQQLIFSKFIFLCKLQVHEVSLKSELDTSRGSLVSETNFAVICLTGITILICSNRTFL